MIEVCLPCSRAGRVRLVEWWSYDGTPLCAPHARELFPDHFAEDVRVSKAYL